ncbi:MAG TPA: FtsQ-type POTRA domain-containing protein [Ktedonobacterales bacterium]
MPHQKRTRTTRATPGRVRAPFTTYAPPRANPRRRETSAPAWLAWLRPRKRSPMSPVPSAPPPLALTRTRSRAGTSGGRRVGLDLRTGASRARASVMRSRQHRPIATHGDAFPMKPPSARPPAVSRPRPRLTGQGRLHIHPALKGLLVAQVALIALAIWGLTSPTWQVRHIRVEGTNDPVLRQAIQQLPLTGCNIFRCDLVSSARQVQRLPLVAHAQAHASYPDTMVIVVTPRQPAVIWHTSAGDLVLATDGTVLGASESDPTFTRSALPRIDDDSDTLFGGQMPHPGQSISAVLVEMAGQLRRDMSGALGNGWALRYTADRGFVATSADGRQVLFGTPSDAALATQIDAQVQALPHVTPPSADAVARGVQRQLAELRALLAQLKQQSERATLIDLRWGAHPYYRTDG